jgi:hypothetical protein
MFEHKEHLLRELLEEKRHVPVDSTQYLHLVAQYNEILNSMIDGGMSEPLEDDLLIDPHLLSNKYFDFERRCEQGYTIDRFVKEQCSFVCLAVITKVRTSSAHAKVLEQYLGILPRHVEVGFFIPWGFNNWFKEGEQTLIFLDQSLISLGLMGRMPIFWKDGTGYVASYSGHRDFWPYGVDVREDVLDGENIYRIELGTVKCVLSEICREGISLPMGEAKSLATIRKVRTPTAIKLVEYVGKESTFYTGEGES